MIGVAALQVGSERCADLSPFMRMLRKIRDPYRFAAIAATKRRSRP